MNSNEACREHTVLLVNFGSFVPISHITRTFFFLFPLKVQVHFVSIVYCIIITLFLAMFSTFFRHDKIAKCHT